MLARASTCLIAVSLLAPGLARAQDAGTEPPLDAPPPAEQAPDGGPAAEAALPASSAEEPVPPPPPDYAAEPGPEGGEATEDDDFRFVDANSTRTLLTPTGETHPDGTVFFTSHALSLLGYELLILQFGYALTDHVQASLIGMPPLYEGQPYFFEGAVAANVLRNDEVRLAGVGAFELLVLGDEAHWGVRLAAVGTLCFGQTCQSNASGGLGVIVNDDIASSVPFAFNLGAIVRLSDVVALLAEPIFIGVLGDETEIANAMILGWGVRLSGARWGLDLGFMKLVPFGDTGLGDDTILGWPVLSFTYRTDPSSAAPVAAPVAPPIPEEGTPRGAILRSLTAF